MSAPTVTVRGLVIGEGMPKICVPVFGKTSGEIYASAKQALLAQPDLVEWRADHFCGVSSGEEVKAVLKELRAMLGELPLLFTFRTKKEGGEASLMTEQYRRLLLLAASEGAADLVDTEYFSGIADPGELVEQIHHCGCKVVMSSHDFEKTPPKEELVSRLCGMQALGADIAKLAVMPQSSGDVLTLLEATEEMKAFHAETPVITMSMAAQGAISRLCGELFGSSVTFGSAGCASAPGQVAVGELRQILKLLHGGF